MKQSGGYFAGGRHERTAREAGYLKRIGRAVLSFVTAYMLLHASAQGMEATLEVAAGYDDNVAEVTEAEGSGMIQYRAQAVQSLMKEEAASDFVFFLDAVYAQYFDFDNNYEVRAGAELSTPPIYDRLRARFFVEATAYRDDLVAEDEHNTILAGGNLQWLATARLTLSLQQLFSNVDYLNSVSLPGQRIYTVNTGKGKGSGGQETVVEEEITLSQEDTVSATEIMATYAMGPDVQMDLSFLFRDKSSTNDYESYQELGGYAKMTWFCTEFLEVFASGYVSSLDYETAPDDIERADDFTGVALGGNWWMGNAKLFVRFDRTENVSPISGEEYEKSVALCGVSYTF